MVFSLGGGSKCVRIRVLVIVVVVTMVDSVNLLMVVGRGRDDFVPFGGN